MHRRCFKLKRLIRQTVKKEAGLGNNINKGPRLLGLFTIAAPRHLTFQAHYATGHCLGEAILVT